MSKPINVDGRPRAGEQCWIYRPPDAPQIGTVEVTRSRYAYVERAGRPAEMYEWRELFRIGDEELLIAVLLRDSAELGRQAELIRRALDQQLLNEAQAGGADWPR